MQALFRHIIGGLCYWYVDDLMAVSPKALYVNNSSLVNSNVQQLLGVALAKSQHDRLSALAQSDIMMWRAFALLPSSYRHAAAKAKETLRINSLKLLHLDSRNDQIIPTSSDLYQWSYGLTSNDILLALQATHTAADDSSCDGILSSPQKQLRRIRICLGRATTIY